MKQIGFLIVIFCIFFHANHARGALGIGDIVFDPT
jgi:hypothetical protein